MSPTLALPAVNFFMADVGGGLGPFLSTYLQQTQAWNPVEVSRVTVAGSIAVTLLATPAGAFIDRIGRPRLMLGIACALIVGGSLALLPTSAFVVVLASQLLVSAGGALGGPSITALTLSVVGKKGFPRQQGTNEAANHAGNVVANVLIFLLAMLMGTAAAFAVLGVMAAGVIAVLLVMHPGAIDENRMRGREKRQKGEKRGATRGLARNPTLWFLVAAISCFHLGNAAALPLLAQRIGATGLDPTSWLAACQVVAQLTMVPVALATGRLSERLGRRWILVAACSVLAARLLLAVFLSARWGLIPIEMLDGIAAGMFSVAAAPAVADITYGSGRTQTALGGIETVQALAAAAALFGFSEVATHVNYATAFAAMVAFPALGIAILVLKVHLRDEDTAPAPAERAHAA